MDKVTKDFPADVSIEDGERAMIVTMTTSAVDRDGEVLVPQGMNAKNFQANPVVMLSHNYFDLPVGKVTDIKRGPNKWSAKVVPAERPEGHPANLEWLPDTLYSLYKQGVMRSVSVGLIPKETRPATDKDMQDYGAGVRRVVSKWELLELSLCAIPCNPEAVASAMGKGVTQSEASIKAFGKAAESSDEQIDEPATKKSVEEPKEEPELKRVVHQIEQPKDEPLKHVVAVVDQKAKEVIRHVHYKMPRALPAARIEKLVIANIQKRRGRIYH